jgi:hypothetical protein
MKHILSLLLLIGVINMVQAEEQGIIGKIMEDGFPVIYSFDNELPSAEVIEDFPTLVVIKWKYDGSNKNGFPTEEVKAQIYKLEEELNKLADQEVSFRAYARTGNGLREFVYYTVDQPMFLHFLNQALAEHPKYPLDIVFYQDPEWSDYKNLMADFKNG